MKRTTVSPRKRATRTPEFKANVIEDSKEKASIFKGLKRKKTTQGYKGKDQEGKNKHFKETYYNCNKEVHKVNECRSHPKEKK